MFNLYFSVCLSYLRTPGWRASRRSKRRLRPRTAWWPPSPGMVLSPTGSWPHRCGKSPGTRNRRKKDSTRHLGRTWPGMPGLWSPVSGQNTMYAVAEGISHTRVLLRRGEKQNFERDRLYNTPCAAFMNCRNYQNSKALSSR